MSVSKAEGIINDDRYYDDEGALKYHVK